MFYIYDNMTTTKMKDVQDSRAVVGPGSKNEQIPTKCHIKNIYNYPRKPNKRLANSVCLGGFQKITSPKSGGNWRLVGGFSGIAKHHQTEPEA